MNHPEQRVGIFIDVQNLYHSAKNLYGGRVNYKELIKNLIAGRKLVRALGYVIKAESAVTAEQKQRIQTGEIERREKTTKSEASFFEALKQSGIELRMKDIQIFHGGAKKADWDVGLAVDSIRMSDSLDVVVLVTGDGDFIPLIEYLRSGRGKIVEVAAFARSASSHLKEVADRFIAIDELSRVVMKSSARRGRNKGAAIKPPEE